VRDKFEEIQNQLQSNFLAQQQAIIILAKKIRELEKKLEKNGLQRAIEKAKAD
jgi:hypothetical protein